MSFVTTARFTRGHRLLLSESTSAVFPLPTGPATPMRKALISEKEIALRHRQLSSRLAGQQLAICADLVSLRVHFNLRCSGIVAHVRLPGVAAVLHFDLPFPPPPSLQHLRLAPL